MLKIKLINQQFPIYHSRTFSSSSIMAVIQYQSFWGKIDSHFLPLSQTTISSPLNFQVCISLTPLISIKPIYPLSNSEFTVFPNMSLEIIHCHSSYDNRLLNLPLLPFQDILLLIQIIPLFTQFFHAL